VLITIFGRDGNDKFPKKYTTLFYQQAKKNQEKINELLRNLMLGRL